MTAYIPDLVVVAEGLHGEGGQEQEGHQARLHFPGDKIWMAGATMISCNQIGNFH
jgi:hypothetical protein